jgi:hypothetical protein
MNSRIRKQVDELCAEDFEAFSGWEYASDEEGRNGLDECTVRPLDPSRLKVEAGQVMIQAVFFFPNGRVRLGMMTLNAGDDPSGHQPVMFLGKKHLHFYSGASEPSKTEVRSFRKAVEQVCPSPFPIRFVSSVLDVDGRPIAYGELRGLYWLANWRTNELRVAA